jgi:site-specific recombinase
MNNPFNSIKDSKKILQDAARIFRENGLKEKDDFDAFFKLFIDFIAANTQAKLRLEEEVLHLLNEPGLADILSNSNINNNISFGQEFFARLRHKILPKLRTENKLRYKLRKNFDFERDEHWLRHIDEQHMHALYNICFNQLEISEQVKTRTIRVTQRLAYRLAALGTEDRMNVRGLENEHHPLFFSVPALVEENIRFFENNKSVSPQLRAQLQTSLDECDVYLERVMSSFSTHGASVEKSFAVIKCREIIRRIENLFDVFEAEVKRKVVAITSITQDIFQEEYDAEGFMDFFKENLKGLSLRVSEHASNTGEHYIANSFREYSHFLYAAIGAGFVVSFLVFIKAWMHQIGAPLFWEAILYSLNYVFGFVLIQLFHFTLATKQPAMTASSISKSCSAEDKEKNIPELGITIARVFHTQTISFIGNLIIVFPLPFIFSWLLDIGFDYQLFDTPQQAMNVINNQHPYRSGALWFAAITGFYLFISGIIAGYVDNRVIYSRIPERVKQMKNLHRIIGYKRTARLSKYLKNNAGGLAGNISLGFLLGTATFIGSITGLPFDIRHITFAAGSFSSALYYVMHDIHLTDVIVTFFGILLIGFVNFSVSFGLAFYLACKSRDINILDSPELFTFLKKYLKKFPLDFVRAPLRPRKPEDII